MASKTLVIVESPSKAKTINKYLGSEYVVKSSVGHVRRLPKGAKAIDLNNWDVSYEIDPKKEKVVKDLKTSAKKVENIFLATDLDREGEAIAWHLKEILGKKFNYKRVRFNEITKPAIERAFENPSELDDGLINAQKTRRILDRIVGYDLSAILWQKIGSYGKLSAGRVQSVAVKLVVEREKEIKSFDPKEYWEIEITIKHKDRNIVFKLNAKKSELNLSNEQQASELIEKLLKAELLILKNETTKRKIPVKPPFITSTLQQTSSSFLGFSLSKTMKLAQDLYTGGYISYMRTDSPNLSALSQSNCKQFLLDEYGEKYSTPRNFSSKASNSQEAHEAIRPTDVNLKFNDIALSEDHKKLYKLIWDRFVASQMPQPEIVVNSIKASAENCFFDTSVSSISFDGFYKVMPPGKNSGYVEYNLAELSEGTSLDIAKADKSQHFTKPPSRYSEASLVKELEKRGIGRPSTYQEIITNIQERGYVKSESKRLYATKIANLVSNRLEQSFEKIMDYGFTAGMEQNLDEIAEGKKEWQIILSEFYQEFKNAKTDADQKMERNSPINTELSCDSCDKNRKMQLRTNQSGQFLGCQGYSDEDDQCKNTKSLLSVDLFSENDDKEAESIFNKEKCSLCGSSMDGFIIDEKTKLDICSNSPICSGTKLKHGEFIKPKNEDEELIDCHKCSSQMELKLGRFGKYFACQSESCSATRQLLKNGDLKPVFMDPIKLENIRCQKCDDFYLLRDSMKGLFLAASQFPKNRETRAPLVSEIKGVVNELPEKYKYFANAPTEDLEGDSLVIRFNRKGGTHYLSAEKDNKKKKYFFVHENGSWKEKKRD